MRPKKDDKHDFIERQTNNLIEVHGKDTLVSELLNKLRLAHIEMGKLTAEIDHLNSIVKQDISKSQLRKEIDRLRKANNELIIKLNKPGDRDN